jgi:protein-S-isoprenylcysteine O-methyltransferase Ste14
MTELMREPFFWAFLSMAGVSAGDAIVSNVIPRSRLLGLLVVGSFMLGRTILVLPICPQPRFELAGLHLPLGALVMAVGIGILIPAMRVHWTTGPDESENLRTTGIYGFVRHPGYLGNVLLGLGWALVFQSTIGVALTVVWWIAFVLHAMIEEASLERTYGAAYARYKERVRGRLLPGVPL